MSHQLSDSPARRRRAGRPVPTDHRTPSERYQNGHGDVVVSAGIGEVVLLPRLWDFELVRDVDGIVTLVSRSGLVATTDLADGETASVDEVMTRPSAVLNVLDSRAS